MSFDWRIRRIIPIALKCCIHVLYAVTDPAKGAGEAALPLFLDQTEARRAEKNICDRPPPSLSEGLDLVTVMGYVTLLLSF